MPMPMPAPLSDTACMRLLRGLLAQELSQAAGRRLRPAEAAAWHPGLALDSEGLGLDSLELLACASAVNGFFRLHETGLEDHLLVQPRLEGWVRVIQAGLAEGTSGFDFTTSGSTGVPRRVTHGHAALAAEVAHWAAVFADRRRIIQLVPAHHIYGCIFNTLLAEALGLEVLDGRALSPGRLARALRADDLLVGFPAGWAALLRGLDSLPPGIRAVSSTAPLPAQTHAALRAAGAAEVLEVYGSSETGGIAARASPAEPFHLLPRWHPGQDSEAASVIETATGRELLLPDRAAWDEAGGLRLLGRRDAAVQVGGVNVFPAQVAARLAGHPLVAEAAVRLDVTLPEPRLKAFVTLRQGAARQARAALEAWCREHLPAAERPVRIAVGRRLPKSELAKPADWRG